MENQNPIKVDEPFVTTTFTIPNENLDDEIDITIEVDFSEDGWSYFATHIIYLNSENLLPAQSPDPNELNIGSGTSLINKELSIESRVNLILLEGGADGDAPIIDYKLIIKANGHTLDKFKQQSTGQPSTDYNSKIKFIQS